MDKFKILENGNILITKDELEAMLGMKLDSFGEVRIHGEQYIEAKPQKDEKGDMNGKKRRTGGHTDNATEPTN